MVRIACDPAEIQTRLLRNTSPVLLLHKVILIWNKVSSYCTYDWHSGSIWLSFHSNQIWQTHHNTP